MTTYDVHAHCIPDELLDLLRADGSRFGIEVVTDDKGESAVIAGRVRLVPFRPILGDTGARLAAMDAAGVDIQVLSSWVDLTAYALEPEHGADYSRRVNRILTDHAAAHPDRFLALGTVPCRARDRPPRNCTSLSRSWGWSGSRSPPPSTRAVSTKPDSTPSGRRRSRLAA